MNIKMRAAVAAGCLGLTVCGAGFPDAVGGVITLNVAAGVTNTYDVALPASATKLVKTGMGGAALTVDSTFSGEVDIQEGTLQLNTLKAAGVGSKISVTGDAATLYLYKPTRPSNSGQNTIFFGGHNLTIRGKGVDELGAFRYDAFYIQNVNDDSMLDSLTLSGDAFIAIPSRMGVFGPINLNGHTLTRVAGGAQWMFWKTSNVNAGTIVNKTGTVTYQHSATFTDPANTLFRLEGGTFQYWNCADGFNCPFERVSGAVTVGAGSNSPTRNNFLQSFTVKDGEFWTGVTDAAHSMAVSGELILEKKLYITGSGTLYLHGPIAARTTAADLYHQGPGWIIATGNVSRVAAGLVQNGTAGATFWLGGGTLGTRWLRLGNGGSRNTFYQTGGRHTISTSDAPYIGESANSYGAYVITDGGFAASNSVFVGRHAGSSGLLIQKGGDVSAFSTTSTAAMEIGGRGRGELYVGGGTNDTRMAATDGRTRLALGSTGGQGTLTVTGPATLLNTDALAIGCATNAATNVVNVTGGATLAARRFLRWPCAGSLVTVNADNAVFKPTWYSGWNHAETTSPNFSARTPDHFVVHAGGLTLDLSEATGRLNFPYALEAPSGKRIASISLPTDSTFTGLTYYGPAFVDIEGPAGSYGATAFADFDFETKKLKNVVVTGGGCNYDTTTKVYVYSPNGKSRYACTYTLADNPAGGALTKRGGEDVWLYAANSYTGGTVVEEGQLTGVNAGTIPDDGPVTVWKDATLYLTEHPLRAKSLSGAGTIQAGNVSVTDAIEITAAELFTRKEPLKITRDLTVGTDVKVTVTDPENLADYKHAPPTAFVRAGTGGDAFSLKGAVPTLQLPPDVTGGWTVFKSGDELKFGIPQGTVIVVR